jgi:transposase
MTEGEEEILLVPASHKRKAHTEPVVELPSARQLSSFCVKDPVGGESHDQRVLAFIRQEKEQERASQMTRQLFQRMKNTRSDDAVAWVRLCSQSGSSEREAFALGIQKERPAFVAACSLASRNGMAEGCVNTRKPMKGSMDGRGSFAFVCR